LSRHEIFICFLDRLEVSIEELGMRRTAALWMAGLALVSTACLDTTEPAPLVVGAMVNAIPGTDPATALINHVPQGQLPPLEHAYFVLSGARHSYQFVYLGDTLSIDIEHTRDITAVVLLDLGDPTVRQYSFDRVTPEQRMGIVNAHAGAGNLEVTLETFETSSSQTLAPGGSEVVDLPTGSYSVRVRGAEDTESVELDPITVQQGEHLFLIIVPGDGPDPYRRIVF
jgi:hypothetical protein